MIAYLDRNIFSQLRRRTRGATVEDETVLRAAIQRGDLSLILSVVTLSETLLMQDRDQALDEIRWVIGLTGLTHIVKDVVALINDCIQAYAHGAPPPPPYTMSLDLSPFLSPTPDFLNGLVGVIEEYGRQRTAFSDMWTRRLEAWKAEGTDHLPFKEFVETHAGEWLRALAERAGVLDDSERRGLDGLLSLKTMRLAVVVPLALAYAKMFRDRELEEADFGDLHHIVTATPANVFVTHEGRLRELIHRARVPSMELLTLTQLVRRMSDTR
jgi:hypothetical protein